MIYKYFDFIKEGSGSGEKSEDRPIYWDSQLNEIIGKEWIDFSSKKHSDNIYFIKFKINDGDKYPFESVLVKNEAGKDIYMMENGVSDKFIQKFKNDFFKNISKYAPEFKKFRPKCLGDWNQIENMIKYNV